jgi:hypothetical protein
MLPDHMVSITPIDLFIKGVWRASRWFQSENLTAGTIKAAPALSQAGVMHFPGSLPGCPSSGQKYHDM